MLNNLSEFLVHWAITALALWVASAIFSGIRFSDKQSLFIAALLLGFANAIVRPVLVVMLVGAIVPGFKVSGFWTAFFVSIFIAIFSFFIGLFIFQSGGHPVMMPTHGGVLI